jgi:hypothetical protein
MKVRFLIAALTLLFAVPVLAHHAFSAEFDANAPITLKGEITRIEWINPHTWIHIAVNDAKGKSDEWMVEGGTPNTLQRRGITRDSLAIGTVIVVQGFRSKDGRMRANGRNLTYADGRTLFMGSSGTGAPRDGNDPTEGGAKKKPGA